MFTYKKEQELQNYLVENFDRYFDFSYIASEVRVVGGSIDLLGEDEENVYLVELKRKEVNNASVKQLARYMKEYKSNKKIKGIVAAPSFSEKLNRDLIPHDIQVMKLEGVECINPNPQVNATRVVQMRITKKTPEPVQEWIDAQGKDLNKSLITLIEWAVDKYGITNVMNDEIWYRIFIERMKAQGIIVENKLNEEKLLEKGIRLK